MAYLCNQGVAPQYLLDIIKSYQPARNLRSSSINLLTPYSAITKGYGQRAFQYAIPKLWNSLPNHLRECQSFEQFKTKLKHIFLVVIKKKAHRDYSIYLSYALYKNRTLLLLLQNHPGTQSLMFIWSVYQGLSQKGGLWSVASSSTHPFEISPPPPPRCLERVRWDRTFNPFDTTGGLVSKGCVE